VLPTLIALAGCSVEEPEPGVAAMWVAEIDRVLADDPSDVERAALADYTVSDAELREAQELFRTCIDAAGYGFDVGFPESGGHDIGPLDDFYASFATQEEADSVFRELVDGCAIGTTWNISSLYHQMRDNPRGLSLGDLVQECFRRHDVPDGHELTGTAFEQYVLSEEYEPSGPQAKACVDDPYGSD